MKVGIFNLPYDVSISKNNTHRLANGHLYVIPEANAYKKSVADRLAGWRKQHGIQLKDIRKYRLTIRCWLPIRGGKGKGRPSDITNYVDWLTDSVAAGLNRDDCHCIDLRAKEEGRVSDDEARFQIVLEVVSDADLRREEESKEEKQSRELLVF